jgi:hypothetical protein
LLPIEDAMQDILGRIFSVGDGEYRVVDVRQLSGEVMVYAEQMAADPVSQERKPRRAAFHYGDIAGRLEAGDTLR